MSSSKLLKERIESIQDTMKITNAMYLISSSKLRKARQNYQNVSPYFNRMRDTISRVVPHLPEEPEQLGLTGVEFAKERAEEAARKAWREQFDLASARAVAALPMLAEYCLPLVKVGGNFLAMKGSSGEEELAAARGAIKKLGGEYKETRTLHLPGGDTRTLILCKKISQTPTAYPRNGGKIAKSPLK